MKVGKNEPKEVSNLNNRLYLKAVEILEGPPNRKLGWHIGWMEVGNFIDWLEQNYNITPKEEGEGK